MDFEVSAPEPAKFKAGDLVTLGDDTSTVYTLEDFDQHSVKITLGNFRRLFSRMTGEHLGNMLPSLKRHGVSEPQPSTPVELATQQVSGGLRYDTGKLRLDLLPAEWELELARITTEGSKKYAPRNWEKGMAWSKMIGCFRRHVLKFMLGEKYDKETGCHHLGLAAWNLLALMSYDMRKLGDNDLPPSVAVGPNFERANNGEGVSKPAGLD
jgi:hypothetical protein